MPAPRFANVQRAATGELLLAHARWCATFRTRLRGHMFRRSLGDGDALILVEPRASRVNTAIHMFFVPFDIAAVWLDDDGRVVDKVLARSWRPFYAPRAPARYVLETHPDFLARVSLGERLLLEAERA